MKKKIDIFVAHIGPRGERYYSYAASTNTARTCREARHRYYDYKYPHIALADIKVRFAAPSVRTINGVRV